jgi:5-methyltetrahydrofolate--homocysteine methyltransferase
MKIIKELYGVRTTLGTSNISFGLPQRKILNKTFLSAALAYGLDAPIMDPTEKEAMDTIRAFEVLCGKDKEAEDYIAFFSDEKEETDLQKQKNIKESLDDIIVKGLSDKSRQETLKLLTTKKPLEIVNSYLIPSLEIVGQKFETGEIFLPQLIKSAETAKTAFEVIKEKLANDEEALHYEKIILATVQGDIHDIGKNIVKILLENYGYEVLDLGKDVAIEDVVTAATENEIQLVGLSALMTTTVTSMEKTIRALKEKGLKCKVMVGGAVLNHEYASQIGADFYCRDGMAAVRVANELFREKETK